MRSFDKDVYTVHAVTINYAFDDPCIPNIGEFCFYKDKVVRCVQLKSIETKTGSYQIIADFREAGSVDEHNAEQAMRWQR